MKCSNHHQTDALAVCVFCGCGLCSSCITRSGSGRIVCSATCAQAIAATEAALESIRQKTLGSNKLAARLSIGAGLLFAGFSVYQGTHATSGLEWFLTLFTGGLGAALIITGIALSRAMRKKSEKGN